MSENQDQIGPGGGPPTSGQRPLKKPDFLEQIGLKLPDEFKAELLRQFEEDEVKLKASDCVQTTCRSRPAWKYYDNWRAAEFECAACKWHGLGSVLEQGDTFEECYELLCPSCFACILVLGYPSLADTRANWDKLSESERNDLEQSERRYEEFRRRKLREPSQLPDIDAPSFTLDWDLEPNGSDHNTVIKHGTRVIFTEPACYEGYRRFIQVAEILRRRYGPAIQDLVPTDRSKLYLYGDRLSAPQTVDYERKRIFSTLPQDAAPDHRAD